MRAIVFDQPGPPDAMYHGTVPLPTMAADAVLLRVHATALNRADLLQRMGKYPPPQGASTILGLEAAGTIEICGTAVTDWKPGDHACAILSGGGYAEYVAVPAAHLLPIPSGFSFAEAAAIPEAFLTAYQALNWIGGVQPNDRVLIHAGASGVGSAAIQLSRRFGAIPYVTASANKHACCLELGAEVAIDYRSDDFAERLGELTDGRGVDLILDFIGAPYFERNVRSLARDGRLVLLGMLGGGRLGSFHLGALFKKRARIEATTLRSRNTAYKSELVSSFITNTLDGFSERTLRPVIDRTYSWTNVIAAHQRMEANQNLGKIVLTLDA